MKTDEAGRLHCEDGPAVVSADGSWVWFRHGRIHRDDGPAVFLHFGTWTEEQYWIDGTEQTSCRVINAVAR